MLGEHKTFVLLTNKIYCRSTFSLWFYKFIVADNYKLTFVMFQSVKLSELQNVRVHFPRNYSDG